MRTSALFFCLLGAACLLADEPSARELYQRGRAAEKAGHMAQAYLLYAEAAALAPNNHMYWLRAQAVQSRAGLEAKPAPTVNLPATADRDFAAALDRDPPPVPEATPQDVAASRRALPPMMLEAKGDPVRDFDLRGDSKELFQELAKAYSLEAIFDVDYVPGTAFRFELHEATYRDAFHAMEAATGSFIVPITSKIFLVAKDTMQKRTELEPTVAVAIRLPEPSSQQDFNSLVTAVQQAMGLEKVSFDTQNNTVILRDRVSKVMAAQALFRDLLYPRAQVIVDMEIIEVTRTDMLTYGIQFPTLFSLTPLTNWFNNPVNIPQNIVGLLKFGGGKTAFGIGIMMPEFEAQFSRDNSKVLLSSQLRSVNGQPATFHAGDRYPILTSGYFGSTTPGTTSTGTTNTGTSTGTTGSTGVTGTGTLTLGQTSIAWTYSPGGAAPDAVNVTVNSSGGTIGYTSTVTSSSPWLTVNGQTTITGTLPTTLTIAPVADLSFLGAGSYLGTVQISGSDGSVAYVSVTLVVSGGTVNLTLSPTSIQLSAGTGGLSVEQAVTLTSNTNGTLSAQVLGTGLSLSVSTTTVGANTPVTLTVSGNPIGLAAQVYQGILSVTVGDTTQELPVTFTVFANGSVLLSQNAIPWTYSSGGTLPATTTITASSTSGTGSFTATASSAGSWLLVNDLTSLSGTLPATLTISPAASVANLSTGTYTGTVQFNAADGSIAYLNVTLIVNGGTVTGLAISPNPITVSANLQGAVAQQTISIISSTAGALTASVTGSGLSLSNVGTSVDANVSASFSLNADPTGLTANTYIGSLTVTVGDNTQTVQVSFSVGSISSGSNGVSSYIPPPAFSFEDLGLTMKITPLVHGIDETSIDLDAEYKVLTGQSINGLPIIANRSIKSVVRLKMGEWAVVSGLLNLSDSHTIAGLAGFSRIPYLNWLTSTREHDKSDAQLLVILRPRLITPPPGLNVTGTYSIGTETRTLTPLY